MNLAKKTVTAIQKWRKGIEKESGIQYRNKQMEIDPIAHSALLASLEKNQKKKIEENLKNIYDFKGNNTVFTNNNREWND